MKEKAIVSSFICREPAGPESLEFALFKRSKNVRTYKEKWAICSGSIETTDPTPEFAARREIEEETQVTSSDISLFRVSHPFKLVDKDLDITWLIHCFAFMLRDPKKELVIEGEHTEYRFIKPQELENYDHVPLLEMDMKRCFPGKEMEEGLRLLRDDHDNGAEVLATNALEILKKVVHGEDFDVKKVKTVEEFWFELRLAAWTLGVNGRPDMGPAIVSALNDALINVANGVEERGGDAFKAGGLESMQRKEFKSIVDRAISTAIEERKNRMNAVSQNFLDYITESEAYASGHINILTLSYSSSVTKALKTLINNSLRSKITMNLNVLESRPRFDSLAFVKDLFSSPLASVSPLSEKKGLEGLKVTILSDAAVAQAAKEADFVVIGCDRLAPCGAVSNKIGSLPACLLAKTLQPNSKVVVVTTTDKIMDSDPEEGEEHKNYDAEEMTGVYPSELAQSLKSGDLATEGAKIEVRNTYFEWVDARYVDVYVTEKEDMDKSQLKKFAEEKKEVSRKLFEGLLRTHDG